jgi:hypothetical protein
VSGGGASGIASWYERPGLGLREARREIEDRLAALVRDDVARGERLSVADPVDHEADRRPWRPGRRK